VFSFDLDSPLAPLVFNILNISAVLVITEDAGHVAARPRPRRVGGPAVRRRSAAARALCRLHHRHFS
jgi:hypothetical protein